MNVEQLLKKHGNKRFITEGLNHREAYMVIEDTILYIQADDMEMAEGLPLHLMQPLIKRHFSLASMSNKLQ